MLRSQLNGWLCQDCKSVNSSGANNCYRCWTPRKFAEAPDPATLPPGVTVEQAHAERQQRLRPSLADARSSRRRAWVTLAFITVTVAFSALSLAFTGAKGGSLGIATSLLSGDWTGLGSLLAISLTGGILTLLAAIAWFVWFDRVLRNVPPLTGTWPEVSRVMSVVWWLVPVVGPFKGTFIVGHIYSLMAVAGSPGMWLLGAWALTWIGGTVAPNVVGFVIGWLPVPLETSVQLQDVVAYAGQVSYIVSGFFAAALILAFEHAREVRTTNHTQDLGTSDPDFSLSDRLAGRQGAPSAPAWTPLAPPGTDAAWPEPTADWSAGPTAWAGPSTSAGPGAPAWEPQPPPQAAAASMAAHDPDAPPKEPKRRRDRGPVPFEPILLMGALVLVGVVAGITMAGAADPFGSLGRIAGQAPTSTPAPTPTSTSASGATPPSGSPAASAPAASAPATSAPASTVAPGSTVPAPTVRPFVVATPAATLRPVPAELVVRRLLRIVNDDDYSGLADVHGTLTTDAGTTTWDVSLGHTRDREWRLQEVRGPDGEAHVRERVILVRGVWQRGARSDWQRRSPSGRDTLTAPLFDLKEADDLDFREVVDEDGTELYRFGWRAGDARIQELIASLGGPSGLRLRSGQLDVTREGVPVRLELGLAGDGPNASPSLALAVDYSEVGSAIEIRSPRLGPPLVVRH